jgi:hypothetical protein
MLIVEFIFIVILNVVMLSVLMLNVVMLSVLMFNVVMLSVLMCLGAPFFLLLAAHPNVRLGWKGLPTTNTLAYYQR